MLDKRDGKKGLDNPSSESEIDPTNIEFSLSVRRAPSDQPDVPSPSTRITPALATVIVGVLSLLGASIGSAIGYFQALNQQESEQETRLSEVLTNAETTLKRIKAEADSQAELQRERLDHDKQMAERKLASDIVLGSIGQGETTEQITNLKAYAKAGLLGEVIGNKLLALEDAELPSVAPQQVEGRELKLLIGPEAPRDGFEFSVINGRLYDENGAVPFRKTTNQNGKLRGNSPRFAVVDYTGSTLTEAMSFYRDPGAKTSAHLLIGRHGEVVQMVLFDEKAWHAGRSSWNDISGLNDYSVGIDLVAFGRLTKTNSQWVNWRGDVIEDKHVDYGASEATDSLGWHSYTELQRRTLEAVLKSLVATYSIEEVLRSSQISPNRKDGPGPYLDVENIASRAFTKE